MGQGVGKTYECRGHLCEKVRIDARRQAGSKPKSFVETDATSSDLYNDSEQRHLGANWRQRTRQDHCEINPCFVLFELFTTYGQLKLLGEEVIGEA